jgi:hypothetical protein
MIPRTVKQLLYAHEVDMGGLPVLQPIPTHNVEQIDPFLLLHHANIKVPENRDPLNLGVGPHPHRGFSPVTFIYKGGVHHRDSRGNDSVVYEGGVQWMNVGMGIIHSERPPNDIHERGGVQEIIQLWVNTPQKHKMEQPEYYPASRDEMKAVEGKDAILYVVAGELADHKGVVQGKSPVNAYNLEMQEGGSMEIPIPEDHNCMVYLLEGTLKVDGFGIVEEKNVIWFNNDGEGISLEGKSDSRALVLSGKPLNEPMVSYGPFVMNTQTEIMQAMRDYQMGKMGVLIEE